MRFTLNSLRARIALIVLLGFLPAFLLIIWTAEDQRRVAIENAETDALNLTRIIAADNAQLINSAYQLLTVLAQLPAVRQSDTAACSALFADMLEDYKSYSNLGAVNVETGYSFCSGVPMEQPISVTQQAWYQTVLQTQDFVVSEYRIGLLTGVPIVTIALPVRDEVGQMKAVVTASLSLGWLDTTLQRANLPADATVTLLDKEGVVLARRPGPSEWVGHPFYNKNVLAAVRAGQQGTVRSPDEHDMARLYGFTHIGPMGGQISVVIGFPESRILADAEAIRNRNVATLIGISLTVIILTWFGSSVVLRPIKSLIETSHLIAAGELTSRTKLNTNIVELEQLLHAFNEMASSVEKEVTARMAELAATNEQLRYEIDERTQAQAQTKILQELTASLSEAVTSEQIEAVVVDKGLVPVGSHFSVIALYDDTLERLRLQTKYPLPAEMTAEYRVMDLNAKTPLAEAFVEDKTIWIETLQEYEQRYPILFGRVQPVSKTQAFACLPLWSGKKKLGSLLVSFPASRSMDGAFRVLLTTIADYCAQTLERVKLAEQATEAAAFEERQRLARDLHDAVSQTLFSATTIAEALPRQWDRAPEKTQERLAQVVTLNRAAMAEMRALLLELRPDAIDKTELKVLLSQLIDAAKGRKYIKTQLNMRGTENNLPSDVHIAFYRIAQESINNILKHSQATQFVVDLDQGADTVRLTITDDGRGFDPGQEQAGLGMGNMRERAAAIHATLDVNSQPEQGTSVRLVWPRHA